MGAGVSAVVGFIRAIFHVFRHIGQAGAIHTNIDNYIPSLCILPGMNNRCCKAFRSAVRKDHTGKFIPFGDICGPVNFHVQIAAAQLHIDFRHTDFIAPSDNCLRNKTKQEYKHHQENK